MTEPFAGSDDSPSMAHAQQGIPCAMGSIAPKFNIVSEPNDWTRSVASSAERLAVAQKGPTKQLQLEYWTAFAKVLRDGSILRPQKHPTQNWMNIALGELRPVGRSRNR